jgi:hypothetical protein
MDAKKMNDDFREIKNDARVYALRPRDLDLIADGFSKLIPNALVRALGRLIDGGFRGGELRAAMVYARWSRRVGRAIRRAGPAPYR